MQSIETYKHLTDELPTWVAIWREGGDELLDVWSDWAGSPAPELVTPEKIKLIRKTLASVDAATCELDLLNLIGKIHTSAYQHIASSPHCSEQIIELLWVGNYVNSSGHPDEEMVISSAFFNNHFKLTAIYKRRPDLRPLVSEEMRRLIELSLAMDGYFEFSTSRDESYTKSISSKSTVVPKNIRHH